MFSGGVITSVLGGVITEATVDKLSALGVLMKLIFSLHDIMFMYNQIHITTSRKAYFYLVFKLKYCFKKKSGV